MRKNLVRLGLVTVLLVTVFVVAVGVNAPRTRVAEAQEDGMVVCDSTLVLLLLLAEGSGYHSDLAMTIDHGQWSPFFAMMMEGMAEMSEEEMTEMEAMMGMMEEAMAMSMEDLMGMMGEMSEGDDMAMTMLDYGHVDGESEDCSALREELNSWFFAYFYVEASMMMMEEEG